MLQGIQDLPVAVRWLPGNTNDAADALSRYSASIQSATDAPTSPPSFPKLESLGTLKPGR